MGYAIFGHRTPAVTTPSTGYRATAITVEGLVTAGGVRFSAFYKFSNLFFKPPKHKNPPKKTMGLICRSLRFQRPITLEEQKFSYKRYHAPKLGTNPGIPKIMPFSAFYKFSNLIFKPPKHKNPPQKNHGVNLQVIA